MALRQDIVASARPLAGFIAIGLAWACYFAQMPAIKANVGASDGGYGLALFLASLGAIAAMWLAPLFRRLFGGVAVAVGILLIILGLLGAGAATSLLALTVAMTLMSAGSGVADVLVNARVSEIEESTGRTLMNLNHAIYSFAYAGAALATGAFRDGGAGPFEIFLWLTLFMLLLAWAARDQAPTLEEAPEAPAGSTGPLVFVTLAGFIVLAGFLAEAAAEGWSALHVERTLGGSPAEGALGPALMGLMMGVGRLSGHLLARFMRDTVQIALATCLSALGLVLAAIAGTVPVALLGFALGGLGISVVAPLTLALVGRTVRRADRLWAISRASVLGYGAFFLGPPLMGLISQGYGLRVAFLFVASLLALTVLAVLPFLMRRAQGLRA